MSEEERQFVRQVAGMANNLNQLTKEAHEEIIEAMLQFRWFIKNELKARGTSTSHDSGFATMLADE